MIPPAVQADSIKHSLSASHNVFNWDTIQQQGQGNILAQRQMREDVKSLENKSKFLAPEPGCCVIVQ